MTGASGDDSRFLPGRHPIDAYGAGGFRFGGMSHRGSILALPSGIRSWAIATPADLTADAFAPVLAEADTIDLLFVGMGVDVAALPRPIRDLLGQAGIGVEVASTSTAARTFNVLVAEDRRVAAALIAVG